MPELVTNPYTFTGRRFDPESGLYYYRARYNDAKLGRFLSRGSLKEILKGQEILKGRSLKDRHFNVDAGCGFAENSGVVERSQ